MLASPVLAQDVTITFWGSYGNGGNSTQQDALNDTLIPAFEAAHPGIKVKYVDVPYDLAAAETDHAAQPAANCPDLVRADLGWVPQFADLGVLVPLSDAMADFQELRGQAPIRVCWPPTCTRASTTACRSTPTRACWSPASRRSTPPGFSAPPASFDELKAMAAQAQGQRHALSSPMAGSGAWNIMPWIWSGGGDITDAGLTKSTGYLDSGAERRDPPDAGRPLHAGLTPT